MSRARIATLQRGCGRFGDAGTRRLAVAALKVTSGDWAGVLFITAVLVGFVVSLSRNWLRQRRNTRLEGWVRAQPLIFSTPVFAQKCYRGRSVLATRWVGGWNPNSGRRPELLVRRGAVELVSAPGVISSLDVCWRAETVVMWRDRVGLRGGPAKGKDCLRLRGVDKMGPLEFALIPDSGIEAVWEALVRVGVRERERLET